MIIEKKTTLSQNKIEIMCRNDSCIHPAMCNSFVCYKKKQGLPNCDSCEERLCKRHWRVYFRNNI
ncbi:MAG: hypothetical protein ACFFAJ_00320 [Candidatus Hodarchaeota archaeon]